MSRQSTSDDTHRLDRLVTGRALKVLVAPDSFKGSLAADRVAAAIARGWSSVRPSDEVSCLPQADGGEGTLEAVAAGSDVRVLTALVDLPSGSHEVRWLLTADGTAVIELAECCGLPLLGTDAPLTASTRPVGQVMTAAMTAGAQAMRIGLGGSASTDGGAGALAQLGLRILDHAGAQVPDGGTGLLQATRLDTGDLTPPPPGGVELLCDVTAPLFGPTGAAVVFAPQKGANSQQVRELDEALRRWHGLVGGAADAPGAGAAGGIAYGLASLWQATVVSGAAAVAELTGLHERITASDVVITGEGSFDSQSLDGKVPGYVLEHAGDRIRIVIAGRIGVELPGITQWSTTELAGSAAASLADPVSYLELAGAAAARDL